MALTATSTRDEVIAEIVNNLGYRSANSVPMARALVEAYDHYLLRFASMQSQNGQSLGQWDIRAQYLEIRNKAEQWADQQDQPGVVNGRRDAVYLSVSDFRS